MYRKAIYSSCKIEGIEKIEGETIEQKLVRVMNNEEAIKDGAPIIFTERKDGVKPEHDIRTDRWEIASEAMDKVSGARMAQREGVGKAEMEVVKKESAEPGKVPGDAGGESGA